MTTLIDLQMKVDTTNMDAAQAKLKALGASAVQASTALGSIGPATQQSATTAATALNSMAQNTQKATSAANDLAKGHAGVTREILVLGHEAMTGNFSRIPGSLLVLGERTDVLGKAFSALAGLGPVVGTGLGVVIAAAAGLGVAFYQASHEQKEFAAALGLTSDYAGLATNSFHQLASTVANESNISIGKATDILLALAKSGSTVNANIGDLATVIAGFSALSGEKFADVAKQFESINTKPAEFSREIDSMMHIFTPAQLEMVQHLEDTGHAQEATTEALKVFTEYMNGPGAEAIKNSRGLIDSLAQGWGNLWHNIKNQVGATADTITDIDKKIQDLRDRGPNADDDEMAKLMAQRKALVDADTKAKIDGDNKAKEQQIKNADEVLNHYTKNTVKMEEELEKFRTNLAKARQDPVSGAKYDDQFAAEAEAQIRRRYQPVKTPSTINTQQYKADNEDLKATFDQRADLYKLDETNLKASLARNDVTQDEYDQKIHDDRAAELADQKGYVQEKIANADKLIAKSHGKQGLDDREHFVAELKKLEDDETQNDADYNLKKSTEAAKTKKTLDDLNLAFQKSVTARQQAVDRASAKATMSSGDAGNASAQDSITDKYIEERNKLTQAYTDQHKSVDDLNAAIAQLNSEEAAEHAQQSAIYDAQKKQQQDFSTGWNQAFNQFQEDAANSSKQGAKLFGDMTGGMTDALANFAMTGKLNFDAFTKVILTDLAKIAAEKLVAGIAGSLFGGGGDSAASAGATSSAGDASVSTFAANGGAFGAGVQFFAKGDVFSSPTAFGMSGNRTGVMGEDGPEAIVPLSRGSDGKLGIKSSGGGVQSVQINTPINITMTGGDAGSATDRAALVKQIQDTSRQVTRQEIANALRSGGVMNRVR